MAACWLAVLGVTCLVTVLANAKECHWQSHGNASDFTIRPDDSFQRGISVTISPSEIVELVEGDRVTVYVNFTGPVGSSADLRITALHEDIVRVLAPDILILTSENAEGNFSIQGLFLGRTRLEFHFGTTAPAATTSLAPGVSSADQSISPGYWRPARAERPFEVSVVRAERVLDHVFIAVVTLMVLLANMGMGCKIELAECKEILLKPVAPAIGFLCQFIIMPLVAFGVAVMLKLTGGAAVGFFAAGCAPGGGASNIYTYLVRGDVSLSVTMTLISTTAALGMVPLWLYTLGRYLLRHLDICLTIPFTNILATLAGIILPVGLGLLIQRHRPAWAANIRKLLRPLSVFFILFMFTFGVYCNLYMFKLFTPRMILAGCILPYVGLLAGGLVAKLTCQSSKRIRTIAIETCIQNSGVAILLMKYSLPQPDADIAMVPPVVVATFTPIPLIFVVAAYEVYYRCYRKDKAKLQNGAAYQDVNTAGDEPLTKAHNGSTKIDNDAEKKNNVV